MTRQPHVSTCSSVRAHTSNAAAENEPRVAAGIQPKGGERSSGGECSLTWLTAPAHPPAMNPCSLPATESRFGSPWAWRVAGDRSSFCHVHSRASSRFRARLGSPMTQRPAGEFPRPAAAATCDLDLDAVDQQAMMLCSGPKPNFVMFSAPSSCTTRISCSR